MASSLLYTIPYFLFRQSVFGIAHMPKIGCHPTKDSQKGDLINGFFSNS